MKQLLNGVNGVKVNGEARERKKKYQQEILILYRSFSFYN